MRTGGALQRHTGPTCSSTYGGTRARRPRQFRSPIANFAHPSPFDAQDRASRPPLGPHIRRARSRRERIAALRDGGMWGDVVRKHLRARLEMLTAYNLNRGLRIEIAAALEVTP